MTNDDYAADADWSRNNMCVEMDVIQGG